MPEQIKVFTGSTAMIGDPEARKRAIEFTATLVGRVNDMIIAELGDEDEIDPVTTLHGTATALLLVASSAAASLAGILEQEKGNISTDEGVSLDPPALVAEFVAEFEKGFWKNFNKQPGASGGMH